MLNRLCYITAAVPIILALLFNIAPASPALASANPAALPAPSAPQSAEAAVVTGLGIEAFASCAAVNGALECWGAGDFQDMNSPIPETARIPTVTAGLQGHITSPAVGPNQACVLVDYRVYCWGFNYYGQLGNGSTTDSEIPVAVQGIDAPVISIAAGSYHFCALTNVGDVYCWGWNQFGQVGIDSSIGIQTTPVKVPGLAGMARVSAGGVRSCAVSGTGGVFCWGNEYEDWDGDGMGGSMNAAARPVTAVKAWPSGVIQLGVSGSGMCAIRNGALECWGSNYGGLLGIPGEMELLAPTVVPGMEHGVTKVAFGGSTCAVKDGDLYCWGSNASGQLGDGTLQDRDHPVLVEGAPRNPDFIAIDGSHACAASGGKVWCWGSNDVNQLGDGTVMVNRAPSLVSLPAVPVSVAADQRFTCAVAGGALYCWGAIGSPLESRTPRLMTGFESGNESVTIAAGQACTLASGGIRCITPYDQSVMEILPPGSGATKISGHYTSGCAIVNGAAKCWGFNNMGQLGVPNSEGFTALPVQVPGLESGVTDINTRLYGSCAVKAGKVICWGNFHPTFQVPGISNAIQTSTECAIEGQVAKCWKWEWSEGANDWVLVPPAPVPGTNGAVAIASSEVSCIINASGEMRCWGNNKFGQLGTGALLDSAEAVPPKGLTSGVTAMGTGFWHTCGVQNGKLYCWGYNRWSQVGDNNPVIRVRPVEVVGLLINTPQLAINYNAGAPESIFRLIGLYFPANSSISLYVNGRYAGKTASGADGSFMAMLDTNGGNPGLFTIFAVATGPAGAVSASLQVGLDEAVAAGGTSAGLGWALKPDQPLRPQEGTAGIVALPADLPALTEPLYLPFVTR